MDIKGETLIWPSFVEASNMDHLEKAIPMYAKKTINCINEEEKRRKMCDKY